MEIREMINKVRNFGSLINEDNFVMNSSVGESKFGVGDKVRVGYYESNWDRRVTPYIAKVVGVNKMVGVNQNEYFEYDVEILDADNNAGDMYNTKRFGKNVGEVHKSVEEYMNKLTMNENTDGFFGDKITIDKGLLDCMLKVVNPGLSSDLYYDYETSKKHLYDFFKNEGRGLYADSFIDNVFGMKLK